MIDILRQRRFQVAGACPRCAISNDVADSDRKVVRGRNTQQPEAIVADSIIIGVANRNGVDAAGCQREEAWIAAAQTLID